MDSICRVRYVDAWYSNSAKADDLETLPLQEAYGYAEVDTENVVVSFIKKDYLKRVRENGEEIVRGLVIPHSALLSSPVPSRIADNLANLEVGRETGVTWRDVTHVANVRRYDPSVMQSHGVLRRIARDHIVLDHPKTVRVYPQPGGKHPDTDPLFYRIPVSVITEISQSR